MKLLKKNSKKPILNPILSFRIRTGVQVVQDGVTGGEWG